MMGITDRIATEERMKNQYTKILSTGVVDSFQQILPSSVRQNTVATKGNSGVIRPIHPYSSTILFI